MTVLEVIQRSTEFLARKGVDSPRLQVELLLGHILKMPRLQLYLNFERKLTTEELEAMREIVRRRGNREPLQHLTGSTSFCGFEISVNPNVLVPRPETEVLAEHGWQFLNQLKSDPLSFPNALDFGTGSGCIAIAVAAKNPLAQIYAVEISPAALEIARANATRNQVAGRIEFICAGTLEELPEGLRFDLIISNPPYIPSAEIATLAPEVRDFDPHAALDGGNDGLAFYRQLAHAGLARLKPHGRLMVEFGDNQGQKIAGIFRDASWIVDRIEKDLSGRPRILIARQAQD